MDELGFGFRLVWCFVYWCGVFSVCVLSCGCGVCCLGFGVLVVWGWSDVVCSVSACCVMCCCLVLFKYDLSLFGLVGLGIWCLICCGFCLLLVLPGCGLVCLRFVVLWCVLRLIVR